MRHGLLVANVGTYSDPRNVVRLAETLHQLAHVGHRDHRLLMVFAEQAPKLFQRFAEVGLCFLELALVVIN